LPPPPRSTIFPYTTLFRSEGRKANDSHADCYQYFCVPEYGTANGRLHLHAVHFMRTLPTGSVDPNFGRRVRNRRQLNSLQNTWRSEERFSRNAETDLVCRLLLVKKKSARCGTGKG